MKSSNLYVHQGIALKAAQKDPALPLILLFLEIFLVGFLFFCCCFFSSFFPGYGTELGWWTVKNSAACARRCDANSKCCSFEYSPKREMCNLNSECQPTSPEFEDFDFCVKGISIIFRKPLKLFIFEHCSPLVVTPL